MQAFFQFLMEKSHILGEWICVEEKDGQAAGIAYVETPGLNRRISITLVLKMMSASLKLLTRTGWGTFIKLNAYMAITSSVRPKARHYYLILIGVSPAFQKQGMGKKMLESIHAVVDADASATGIGLDTENFANVAYYEGFGYRLVAEKLMGDVTVYCLFRERRCP